MSNNTEYTFNSNTGPFLVEFDKLVMTENDTTMIWYKVIGSTMRLLFMASTVAASSENDKPIDWCQLSLYTKDGNRIENPKCIKTPCILDTRSAKRILEENGFTLIYSKPRIQDLI
jgi:hypothetical protein